MIQRIQSLFLLGVVIISVILHYIPVFDQIPVSGGPETSVGLSRSALLMLLNGANAVLAFVAIFLFKKRNLQVRFSNLIILITCILIALLFFLADGMTGENQRIHYLVGSYLPIIQVLFAFLATRFIKRDEDLVRSSERLR